jgi:hypothetical protein
VSALGEFLDSKGRMGQVGLGVIELGLAYAFGSLAVDRGNIIFYLLTLTLITGAVIAVVNAVKGKS